MNVTVNGPPLTPVTDTLPVNAAIVFKFVWTSEAEGPFCCEMAVLAVTSPVVLDVSWATDLPVKLLLNVIVYGPPVLPLTDTLPANAGMFCNATWTVEASGAEAA